MSVEFQKYPIKIDENTEADFNLQKFEKPFAKAQSLIKQWNDGVDTFEFFTSGSTGKAKKIILRRDKIIYSTNQTFRKIDSDNKITTSLLCLDPHFIGGAMVIFRSLIKGLKMKVIPPKSKIHHYIKKEERFDLVSMVPLQLENMDVEQINQFSTILIGGAPLEKSINSEVFANIYNTYGMTETTSHVALRKENEAFFETLGDLKIDVDNEGALKMNGTITDHKWLQTNDIVELKSAKHFKWISRKDFIINSGGVKLNPEVIEHKLKNQISKKFIVSSMPDNLLGQKVILIIEGTDLPNIDFTVLGKYEKPKECFVVDSLSLTPSGKIDRHKTRLMIK